MTTYYQALTTTQEGRLQELEVIIEKGLQTFVEVGQALLEIRDSKLYREEFETFDEYCRQKWGMSKTHSNRMVQAAQVVSHLTPIGVIPSSESQTRPLTSLEPEVQREAWAQVVAENEPNSITAKKVEQVAQELTPLNEAVKEVKEEGEASLLNPNPQVRTQEQILKEAKTRVGGRESMKVHYTSDSEEWYTPSEIVNSAISAMGGIDLDPCSNSKGSPNVPALTHFTKEDNGLNKPWGGRVYMNPPYGRVIVEWVEKVVAEYESGNTTEAILLVPARTDTKWMAMLRTFPRCYIRGRLKFSNSPDAAPFPSVAIYLGDNTNSFSEHFSKHGDIYELVR